MTARYQVDHQPAGSSMPIECPTRAQAHVTAAQLSLGSPNSWYVRDWTNTVVAAFVNGHLVYESRA